MSWTRRFAAEESHLLIERMQKECMRPRPTGSDDKTTPKDSGAPPEPESEEQE